jgi:hypothetical protein
MLAMEAPIKNINNPSHNIGANTKIASIPECLKCWIISNPLTDMAKSMIDNDKLPTRINVMYASHLIHSLDVNIQRG